MKYLKTFARLVVIAASLCSAWPVAADELMIYSARKQQFIQPLFDAYTRETGVEIDHQTGSIDSLLNRLKAEGDRTPADILIAVDAGNLWQAADQGLLQPIDSKLLRANIPANLRDPENRWFGLSLRARTIVYSTERVQPEQLSTYAALGEDHWKGRLLLRTSKKDYNQSLVAMMIAEYGLGGAEKIVRGWVKNLAQPPYDDDIQTMMAILEGQGDVAIVNSYYYGRLLRKDPDLKLALFWPNQNEPGSGVHVNVSGAGLTKFAKHPEAAIRFIEWLSTSGAQSLFADANLEYPVNPQVKPSPEVAAWGAFKASPFNLTKAGELQEAAIRLMDRAGYQ
ncbi:MAG: extracellular solute-binding protein [Deltaproteobacteria bacterium]|jgi:iron(III) transport system substrate-binding protein|nr:extracellular solute-binding protein [Deltaproteobacteria bacterium]